MSVDTRERIPPHLRRFVVEQDPSAYDEIDQAVWRFVLLQMYDRGVQSAHPAYATGLTQTGISVERVPSIAEMDACLHRFGWGAVAVDGFIPPRAFQEFQALGILTIAAEIRRPEHLAYTPAPDIIHESAGHAPIVPDAHYREFLQSFGQVGARAFSSRADQRIYEAIHLLSELKEDAATPPERIAEVQAELEAAQQSVTRPSEAALLSRLHWWTVEYGLIGTPQAYKLYGAGLLSSLGESHFLHDPSVQKVPLSAGCIDVAYDITKPQPQLFVTDSFEQLQDVLDEVADELAQRRGGALGLERALGADELGTLELSSGLEVIGVLERVLGTFDDPAYVRMRGECALAVGGRLLTGHGRNAHADGFGTPLGRLEDGTALEEIDASTLARRASTGERCELRFRSGVRVIGRLEEVRWSETRRPLVLSFADCRVTRGSELLFDPAWGRYDLAVGTSVRHAYAGPADPAYWPPSEFSTARVPRRRERAGEEARLIDLYREALALWQQPSEPELVHGFAQIHGALEKEFPRDWLLRWNLLECLRKVGSENVLGSALRRELLEIESHAPRDLPITTGLRYLDARYPARNLG
jgi:phenylalanine-4-hydroxylase